MATPHSVGIVVADMPRALAFYRALGLSIPPEEDAAPHVECPVASGVSVGFTTEAMMRQADPAWPEPAGQRVTVAFRCETPSEVDALYERLAASHGAGLKTPWDAFWGQRYAFLRDPDGNRVDLFAELGD